MELLRADEVRQVIQRGADGQALLRHALFLAGSGGHPGVRPVPVVAPWVMMDSLR